MKSIKNTVIPIGQWYGSKTQKVIIAGPCSAESHEQMRSTALAIHHIKHIDFFRAGIWKPRTRPGNFEGVGERAFPWLEEIKKITHLKTMVEIGTPKHAELCLKNRQAIDVVWIGARTTVSPFAIQEIADVLKGEDIPVLIKNPMHPDIELWIGAVERFVQAGLKKVAAIHRGFYPPNGHLLRNIPHWELVDSLKKEFPLLSVINDPSHISGRRDLVSIIAQEAMNKKMDGLMIETHINPEFALSDAKQQITPFELEQMLEIILEKKSNEFKESKIINRNSSELEQKRLP